MDKSLILNEIKSHYGIKKNADFARFLGIEPTLLANWIHRKTFDYEIIISKCDEINAKWLVSGKGEMLVQLKDHLINDKNKTIGIPLIPIDAIAGKGIGELKIQENDIEQIYVVPEFSKADFLIRAKGNSMYPKYSSGDILACIKREKIDFIQWNKAYVIDTTQGIMVKRIVKGKDAKHWVLRSDNEKYDDIDVNVQRDVYSIAQVIGVIRLE